MIAMRHALYPLIGLCAVVAGCSGKADKLSDAELARMLHTEGLADERIDPMAVDCLRAWSDDSGLAAGLKPDLATESGRSDCRRHMQGWLDDGSRNPQGLMFVDVTTPKLAKRAMDLLAALPALSVPGKTAAVAPAPAAPMPVVTAQAGANEVPRETAEAAYEERVQINNSTNQSLDQYDAACREAQALVKIKSFDPAELKVISQCSQMATSLRSDLTSVIASGNAFEVSMATRGASDQLAVLRGVIDRKR